MSAVLRTLVVAVLAVFAALTGVGVAGAHSAAIAVSPETGSQVAAGPDQVSVTFNEPLQSSFASLTVVGPDDNLWSKGEPTVAGATISVPVGALGPAGDYTIAYRVTSADGHPVSGTSGFTLTAAGTGTPGAPASGGSATGSDDGSGSGWMLWAFIGAGIVVFGAGLTFALRKPR